MLIILVVFAAVVVLAVVAMVLATSFVEEAERAAHEAQTFREELEKLEQRTHGYR